MKADTLKQLEDGLAEQQRVLATLDGTLVRLQDERREVQRQLNRQEGAIQLVRMLLAEAEEESGKAKEKETL